jgi:Flp pilus assembly protein TadG
MGSGGGAAYDAAMSDPDSMLDTSDQAPTVASTEVASLATAAEQTLSQTFAAAEAARKQAKAAAFATYCWNSGPDLVAYRRALADADVAYHTAVNTRRGAAELIPTAPLLDGNAG